MDDHLTIKIDPQTKDFVFDDNGIMETVNGDQAIAQNIQMCLTAWKGDFKELPDHGTDYRRILDGSTSKEDVEEIIRESIYQEKEVEQIEEQTADMDSEGRRKITFKARLNNGNNVGTEVLI